MTERLTRAQQQERTRERLLNAAETLFGDRGIHQTSLDQIAAAAGLTKGAIYANFGSKKELIAAILDRKLTEDDGEPHEPLSSLDGWASSLGDSYSVNVERPEIRRFALAMIELWLYGMREDAGRAPVAEWLRTIRALNSKKAESLATGELPMPVDQLAALMTALDIGVAMQHYLDPEAVPPEVYRAGLEAVMRRPEASTPPGV
jgi:AcrR family transcriptional regulator